MKAPFFPLALTAGSGVVDRPEVSWSMAAGRQIVSADRHYKTLSRCNQALVRAREEQELNSKVCEILVEAGGYPMVWVSYGGDGGAAVVQIVAKAGRDKEDEREFEIGQAEGFTTDPKAGLSARVIKGGQVMISATFNSLSSSVVSLPLRLGNRVFGVLNIMLESSHPASQEEIKLLTELAGDLAFGIATIRERKRHERNLGEKLRLQVQLRQAQKMEAIGTLAGGIAHDFNNMLHAILGYSGLMLRNLPPESDHYKFSQIIHEAGVSAAGLIRQILTFSRQGERERQPLLMQQMLKEALKMLRSTLPTTIELRQSIDMHCAPVLADATEVHQIIMNLGTNAYHAMRQQGGVLEVELAEVELDQEAEEEAAILTIGLGELQKGRHLCLRVSDTGIGMEPEIIQRIFDPYFTTKGKMEGTGLGLAIIQGIVKSYQGAITVRSALGQGSTFKLFFPLFEKKISTGADEVGSELFYPELNCKRVLFVDDVEYNVILGEHTLQQIGCEVTGVTSSCEALEIFRHFPDKFDLVVTDQTMPQLTGFELAGQMLAIRPDLPIILLTGYSDLVDEETAKAAGIHSFLVKPIDLGAIAKVMREIFRQS